MRSVRSVCPYCGVGCGIEIVVEDGKVTKILPQKDHPINEGKICFKTYYLDRIVNSKERLKYPLMKVNGKFKRISWKVAIKVVSEKLMEIRDTYGKNSIGFLASTKCTNEENYILQKFARVAIGTNNIDNSARLCHAPTIAGLYEVLGRSAMTNSYEDLVQSDCILIFGCNPAVTQPIAFQKIKKCKGKIVTIDVRKTETAEQSDIFIKIKPNSDAIFVAGLIKTILEEGLENKEFIEKRTLGYKEFLKSLEKIEWGEIVKKSSVSEKKIREIGLLYGKARRGAIVFGMGITQQQNGMENVMTLTNLALLKGFFGKPGTGVNPLRGCNNVQGACDVGCLPNVYPGYSSLNEETIKKFSRLWGVKGLPISKGLTATELIEGIPERILALYLVGINPLLSFPNLNRVEKNLKNLEFLVIQDIFLTETAKLADVVLPAACFAEKTGTFTNSERRVQLIRKACEPPGEAMEDWKIVKLLAKAMDFEDQFNFNSPQDIFEEIRKAIPFYSSITYKKLERSFGIQWPCTKKHPEGKKILFDKDFGTPGTKAVFYPVSYLGPQTIDHAYPFVLISHRILEHYNTGTFTRRIKPLNEIRPIPFAEINEKDAKKLAIKNNERVRIVSPFGELVVKVRISKSVGIGIICLQNHYTEKRVNKLTSPFLDHVSKIPSLKFCNVKIEKV